MSLYLLATKYNVMPKYRLMYLNACRELNRLRLAGGNVKDLAKEIMEWDRSALRRVVRWLLS